MENELRFEWASPTHNRGAILETIADGISVNTRRAYAQALSSMESYFGGHNWEFYPICRGEFDDLRFVEQILSYLQFLADRGLSYSSINLTLSAIKNAAGYSNARALGALTMKPVPRFMEGVARQQRDRPTKQAKALTGDQLRSVYKSINIGTVRGKRDFALISLGVATALRSQSIANLKLSDISRAVTIDGILVRIRHSKTDQSGTKKVVIPVARVPKKKIDPVEALSDWIAVLEVLGYTKTATPDFPLFPSIRGVRGIQTTPLKNPNIDISNMLRNRVVNAGICSPSEAMNFSSHSLRATFITLSAQNGVAEKNIQVVSGHKNLNILRSYDRTSIERAAQTSYLD